MLEDMGGRSSEVLVETSLKDLALRRRDMRGRLEGHRVWAPSGGNRKAPREQGVYESKGTGAAGGGVLSSSEQVQDDTAEGERAGHLSHCISGSLLSRKYVCLPQRDWGLGGRTDRIMIKCRGGLGRESPLPCSWVIVSSRAQ